MLLQMSSLVFWDVLQHTSAVTDVSGQLYVPFWRVKQSKLGHLI